MWKYKEDTSEAIITAKNHVVSNHKREKEIKLPPKAVVFCIGSAMECLKNNYNTRVILNKIPKFIGGSECLIINEHSNVCFVHGGYGSPAIADTVETLIALGVKDIVLIGMCGGFSNKVKVGDVIIPRKVLSEEGTSLHYYENIKFVKQSEILISKGLSYFSQHFNTYQFNTVTTDAIYRQTFYKEEYWRNIDCVGVDMEASALLSVSKYYGIEPNVILLVSDKHPINKEDKNWNWGNPDFKSIKNKFIINSIKYAICDEHN
ncbi:nucleoside phosphorylase [Clostridium estertheticum]|uniref:nucleoside phosphorylase n=1 Tax=Clostridium estertheticum TaxID=238834 RepID=UPI001C0C4CED|nr:nucleoside phosphorylase [Clostridium estertheticum]MBU3201952.1 nucleoside phosphorylase [Clostridium estertheticum]WAG67806.1 nucleoside phosphorylase [Clostridium estertheticum]